MRMAREWSALRFLEAASGPEKGHVSLDETIGKTRESVTSSSQGYVTAVTAGLLFGALSEGRGHPHKNE
jgi:hypothetical protein